MLIQPKLNIVQVNSFFGDLTYAGIEFNRFRAMESDCLPLKNQQSQMSFGEALA